MNLPRPFDFIISNDTKTQKLLSGSLKDYDDIIDDSFLVKTKINKKRKLDWCDSISKLLTIIYGT